MWIYDQRTGEMSRNGVKLGTFYSGFGEGKNNPSMQNVKNVGPLPVDDYEIEAPVKDPKLGPFVLRLRRLTRNNAPDRDGFAMHGKSKLHPNDSSHGCIVADLPFRQNIWNSGDRLLRVVCSEAT